MIIRCNSCAGALVYDIALGKMKCKYCDSLYEVDKVHTSASEKNMMEGKLFVCTACAAKLMVNDVESATYCAYCGQPTVVFERVSKTYKPDKILPFTITREEAEKRIRKKFQKGFFVPRELKHFKVERISGIYVPFWIYDIDYRDSQLIHVNKGERRVKARVAFTGMTVDGSTNFCNVSSQKLEPYDLSALTDFREGYLSGMYADCYDQTGKDMEKKAVERCKKLFDRETLNSVPELGVYISESDPKWKVKKTFYALLPAWFLTFRYRNKAYTMMVNGQTGKVIGTVPFVRRKVVGAFVCLTAVFMLFLPRLCIWLFTLDGNFVIGWMIATLFIYAIGIWSYLDFKKNISHTSAKELKEYAGERAEES